MKNVYAFLSVLMLMTGALKVEAQTGCDVAGNYCISNTTLNICGGTLFDAGGGNAYPDDLIITTICPDTPGDVIQLTFSAFALQTSPNPNNSDYLTIFDGPDTNAPSLGDYTGNSLQGLPVTATVNNPSGCLTIVFNPNGNPNNGSPGFEAQVACTTPCAPPTAGSDFGNPVPDVPGQALYVCVGTAVTFEDDGSSAQPGFTLEQYNWNFDDGTIDSTSGASATHTFEEPGEYLVTLTVEDNNGCGSLNIEPLEVWVSTIPQFPGVQLNQTAFCFGQSITLDAGEIISPTWTALPPQVVSGETYLADGAGFSYNSSLVFDFFEEGAVIENCNETGVINDLMSIFVNMEHSYMGDLGLTITCPDGTVVDLVEWGTNGGGGTFLGEAVDDESNVPGVGYDYFWAPDATNGTWGENAGGFGTSLPTGTYEAAGDLCDLVGCPLNGEWTFSVTDNLAIDNGYIFSWGINFNPALIPGLTTFTPTIGMGADSSFWSGPFITPLDNDLDIIEITLDEPGSYEYTYTVINSFGCQNDTTIVVNVEQSPLITAGEDLVFSCEPLTIQGGFQELPTPLCGEAAGTYEYCYGDGVNYQVTYCPDNPGDGFSAIEITFLQGSVENFFDEFYVYDGDNTGAPLLAGYAWPLYGDLSGLTFTATNPDGCLTIQLTPDGSVSCASGSQTEWIYEVGCASPVDYEWAWTPADGLNPSDQPVTTLTSLTEPTYFTLTGWPVGIPECAVEDEVFVDVATDMTLELETLYETCPGDTVEVSGPDIIGGTGPYDIQWFDGDGNTINGDDFEIAVEQPSQFCVLVEDACGVQTDSCILVNLFPVIPATFAADSSLGCQPFDALFTSDYTDYDQITSMLWGFGDGTEGSTMGSANHTYFEPGYYYPYLQITDIHGCVYTDTISNPVVVWPTPFAAFNWTPEVAILPNTTIEFNNLSVQAGSYYWDFAGFGESFAEDTVFTFPAEVADQYVVWLYAFNQYGCVDSIAHRVEVQEDIDIYIPNTFTPDYDGINDVWLVEGKGFQDQGFLLQVYNRWGDIVFETTDPHVGWTGGYKNGEYFVPDGVYLYRLEVKDVQNDVTYEYQGHVFILR